MSINCLHNVCAWLNLGVIMHVNDLWVKFKLNSINPVMAAGVFLRLFILIAVLLVGNQALVLEGGSNDGSQYLQFSRNILSGNGFGLERPDLGWIPETYRLPGLPILLVPFVYFGNIGLVVYLITFNILSGLLLPFLLYDVASKFFGKRAGLIAAWLIALEPLGILVGVFLLTDSPSVLLLLASFWIVIGAFERRSLFAVFAGGMLGGLAYIFRPTALTILGAGIVFSFSYFIFKRAKMKALMVVLTLIGVLVIPTAWAARNAAITGKFTYLGMGWRDVYVNYLPSVISLETGEPFHDVKNRLKDDVERFGLKNRFELNDPSKTDAVREYAISELAKRPYMILKLETMLLVSFFTNDGWYSYGMQLGLLPRITGRISPTRVLITQGVAGIGSLIQESARQLFIPVIGRAFTVVTFLLYIYGFWKWRRSPIAWLFFAIPWCLALLSTIGGLGVEGRYRLAVAPLMFTLVGAAFVSPKKVIAQSASPVPNSDPIS